MDFEALGDLDAFARQVWERIPQPHREMIEHHCRRVGLHQNGMWMTGNEARFDLERREILFKYPSRHFKHSEAGWRGVFAHEFAHVLDLAQSGDRPVAKARQRRGGRLVDWLYLIGEYAANRRLSQWGFSEDYRCTELENPTNDLRELASDLGVRYECFLGEKHRWFLLARFLRFSKKQGLLTWWGIAHRSRSTSSTA